MYQILSPQRPGKPRWTLAASALLLLITAGLAAILIQYKNSLYENTFLPSLNLTARLPKNWTPTHEYKIPDLVAHLIEPENKAGEFRQLIIASQPWNNMNNSAPQAAAYLDAIVRALNPQVLYHTSIIQPQPIGHFPGWDVYSEPKVKLTQYKGQIYYGLGRVAVTQSGDIIAILLLLPAPPRADDQQLLNIISKHIKPAQMDKDNSMVNREDGHRLQANG